MSRLTNPPQLYAHADCPVCGAFGYQERNERRRNGSGWLEERKCDKCGATYPYRVCDVVAQMLDHRYPQVVEQGDLFAALPHPTLQCAGVPDVGDSLTHVPLTTLPVGEAKDEQSRTHDTRQADKPTG